MLLQLQFEAFYTVNLLNAKWRVVPARNSGWKKRIPIWITICLEVFEFEAVILPCTGVGWREDVLRFITDAIESVNNFVKKNYPGNIGLPLRFRSSDNFRKFSRSAESRQNSWIKSDTHFRKRFWSGQTDPNSSDFQSVLWHNFSAEKLIKVVLINVLNNYI